MAEKGEGGRRATEERFSLLFNYNLVFSPLNPLPYISTMPITLANPFWAGNAQVGPSSSGRSWITHIWAAGSTCTGDTPLLFLLESGISILFLPLLVLASLYHSLGHLDINGSTYTDPGLIECG
jgi:hypothetical protein